MLPPQGALAFHAARRPSARGRPVGGAKFSCGMRAKRGAGCMISPDLRVHPRGAEGCRRPVVGSEAQASNTFDAEARVWTKEARSWSTVIWTPSMRPLKRFTAGLIQAFR